MTTNAFANAVWSPLPGSQMFFLRLPVFEVLYEGTRASGKALRNDTPIATPDGWCRMGDIRVGDTVFGADGHPTTVLGVYPQGERAEWAVDFSSGDTIYCDADHLWVMNDQAWREKRNRQGRDYGDFTVGSPPQKTKDLAGKVTKGAQSDRNLSIPLTQPLTLPTKSLPVDPWLLGLWLGDGNTRSGTITASTEDWLWYDTVLEGLGENPREQPSMRRDTCQSKTILGLATRLRALGVLGNKHVPQQYLRASHEQRLRLLSGLIDSDGCVMADSGSVEFVSILKTLADAVCELVTSLGRKCVVREKNMTVNGEPYLCYRLSFRGFPGCAMLPRKTIRIKPFTAQKNRTFARMINSIRTTGRRSNMTCIAVDSVDSLYLAGRSMIPTHNTDALLMDYARDVGKGWGANWRGVLFRRTFKELEDVVGKSKRWFSRLFPDAEFRASPVSYKWVFKDGEELAFRHASKGSDYLEFHGHEIPWLGFEELTSWPSLDFYHQMKSVSRSTVPGMPRRIRSTTNPYGPGHNLVKSYFIDPAPARRLITDKETGLQRMRVTGHWSENIYLLRETPDYPAIIALSASNESQKKAWLDGSWDITAGGMFDDIWDNAIHVLRPFDIPSSWRVDRSFDWGDSKPFSVGWHAESDGTPVSAGGIERVFPRGSLIRINEWYGWTGKPNEGLRWTDQMIAEGIMDRETTMSLSSKIKKGPADVMTFHARPGEPTTSEVMRKRGVGFVRSARGNRGARKRGWAACRRMLEAAKIPKGEYPGYWVFDNCRQFLRTVPSLPRSARDPDDVDTETEDHIGDEWRYRVMAPKRGPARSFNFHI